MPGYISEIMSSLLLHLLKKFLVNLCCQIHIPNWLHQLGQGFYTKPGSIQYLYKVGNTYTEYGNLAMWSRPLGVSRTLEYTQQGIQVRTSSHTEQDIRSRILDYKKQSFGSRATNYTEQGIQSKSSRQYTGLVHAAIQSRQPRQLYLILDSSKKLKHIYYCMKLPN